MPTIPFFALPTGLEITAFFQEKGTLCVSLLSTQFSSRCPLCGSFAIRIHSRYQRVLADLPSAGQPVRLLLSVRKFFCDVTTCARKIFVERLTPFVEPWARVTARLFHIVQVIGFATGGMLGARLAEQLEIHTSWMTILRRMMALPTASAGHVSQLGIDDFSFKRGRTFGTILVNMQSHQVIDVLPDRKTETARTWMVNHPEIDLVSRDRGGDYASAATAGAPQAVQCADRFHLLKNLEETVEGLLAHHLAAQRKHQAQERGSEVAPVWQSKRTPLYGPKLRQLQQARREERKGCYEQVVALRRQGFSHQAIAKQVGVGHATVQRWLAADTFPEKKLREQGSQLDRYLPYLHERWNEGCHNMAHLFRDLVEQGYKGSYASVRDILLRLLPEGRKTPSSSFAGKRTPVLSRQAAFLFLRQPENWRLKTKKHSLASDKFTRKLTWLMSWSNNLRRCFGLGPENSSTNGLRTSEQARFVSSKALS